MASDDDIGAGERFIDIDIATKRLPACYGYLSSKLVSLETAIEPIRSLNLIPELELYAKLSKKHCTYPNAHNLTKDEAAAIYFYTMEMSDETSFYRLLNKTLRDEDRTKVKPFFYYLKLFNSAVSKLPTLKRLVFRGVNRDVSESFKKNEVVTWWNISSCSTSVDVIKSFLGSAQQSTLLNIECLHGKSISQYTCYPDENEIVLMPGTTLKVVSNPLNHHGGLHIVHLKEIGDEDDDSEGEAAASSVTHKMNSMHLTETPSATMNASVRAIKTIPFADGTYTGEVNSDDKPHGYGTGPLLKEGQYVGQWQNGIMHGRGVLTAPFGSKYDGEWQRGEIHGRGVLTFLNGSYYDGEWQYGEKHGYGVLMKVNDRTYKGEWQGGKYNGRGVLTFPDGSKYDGDWQEGKQHGRGVFTYADGKRYDGQFRHGLQHGYGVWIDSNGKILKKGQHENGKFSN